MMHLLRRHPFAVRAYFEHCLVLTYAFPAAALTDLVPPGMVLDTQGGSAFAAAAFVQTRGLRPARLPKFCGQDFFLSGYRVFVKHRTGQGRTLRGLRILRSDADRRAMVWGGNLLTHYNYRLCSARVDSTAESLAIRVATAGGEADVDVVAHLGAPAAALPAGSVFEDERAARRFAGPLPWTFEYEEETRSIVRIKGVREEWEPVQVRVDVREMGMIERGRLAGRGAVLASAFHVAGIPYLWERGVVERIAEVAA